MMGCSSEPAAEQNAVDADPRAPHVDGAPLRELAQLTFYASSEPASQPNVQPRPAGCERNPSGHHEPHLRATRLHGYAQWQQSQPPLHRCHCNPGLSEKKRGLEDGEQRPL